jgi:DNA-binding transcriptional MerR regulator/thiol-disulfide isomerase/thioredoxin
VGSTRSYKIHDFAKLAGVTVKALLHYDRLGLLTAKRTNSGYRAYSDSDLERLEQIVALKYLGLPLKLIKALLDRSPLALSDALRAQRLALEEKQLTLARAIRAINTAEASLQPGQPTDPKVLRTIIEVINMQEGIEAMKKYYTESGWKQHQRYYEEGPSPEWLALYRDANALLKADPASDEAQAVADRWFDLSVRAYRGDHHLKTHSPAAWADRDNWPVAMKQRMSEFNLEEVTDFVQMAALHARRKYFSESSWTRFLELLKRAAANPEATSRVWQGHVDLFREIATAHDENPAGQKGRDLAQKWIAFLERQAHGDAEIATSMLAFWSDRAHWPASLRWRTEGLSGLFGETFDLAVDFIIRAAAAQASENTLTFSEASFEQDVLKATVPVLVSVWAEGCTGCARLAPFVDLLAREFKGRARVGKLNAMSNMDLAMRFEVRALPTLLLFVGGHAVETKTGPIDFGELRQILAGRAEARE